MHHFNGLTDVKATPVAAAEGIATRDLTHKILQADVAVFQPGFGCLHPFTGVARVAQDLDIDSFDDGLGARFRKPHARTGLEAATRNRIAAGCDLGETAGLGTNPPWCGASELRAIHLPWLCHAVADEQATGVVAQWCRSCRDVGGP